MKYPMTHYKFGGSTAARTIACPSWVKLAAEMPKGPEVASKFAQEGTMMHSMVEDFLNGDIEQFEGLNELDTDQVERLNEAVEAWDELCIRENIEDYQSEVEMSMSEDIGGTSDIIAWSKDTRFIVDWKFGQGVEVEAEGNLQLLFYAMLDEHLYGTTNHNLAVAIIQPMPSRSGKTLKTWNVPNDVFEMFKQSFMQAVNSEGLSAGPHCRYCPAAPTCPEKTGEARAALMSSPEDLALVAENLDRALNLESWIADVKKFAHDQLELGLNVQGFKLVPKRARRKWGAGAEEKLRKIRQLKVGDVMETALLSPAKIEKIFKAKKLDFGTISAYITKTSTGTTLARDNDPRDAVVSAGALKAALGRIN